LEGEKIYYIMDFVEKVKQLLPLPLRVVIRRLRWYIFVSRNQRVSWDRQLVRDIAEYFNLSYKETILLLKLGCKLNALLWNALHPETEEEISRFYKITPFYIFDLAYWHMWKGMRKFSDEILKVADGDTLDYGGGIGGLCIKLAEKGLDITYSDVPGRTFEFAKWLFEKRGYNIRAINLEKEELQDQYNTIICIDVIEHVPNPEDVLYRMASSLRKGGKLIITQLQGLEDVGVHPMHFKMKFNAEELLKSLGLSKTDRKWLWVKDADKIPLSKVIKANRVP